MDSALMKSKMKFYVIIIARYIFILSVLMLCSANSQADTIKIGIAGSFSGFNKAIGSQQWQGASQAAEDINQQGGINGDKIELINADDGCDNTVAEKVAKKLVDSKVVAVVGHTCSASSLVASKVYDQANILMITPSSTDPKITEQGFKSIFRTCGTNDTQGSLAANFMYNKLKAKEIAIVYVAIPYATSLAEAIKSSLEKLGANVVIYEKIAFSQWDISTLLEKLKSAKPDVIYFAGLYQDAGNFLRKLRENDIQSILVSGDSIATSEFVNIAGGPNNVKDVYMTFSDPTLSGEAKKVIEKFKEKRIVPEGYTLNSYAAVQAIALAIKETKSHDTKKLAEWLHAHKLDSVIGELQWNEKGDLKVSPFAIYKWNDDGEYEPY